MTPSTNTNLSYGEVKFKLTDDSYAYPLLTIREKRNLIQRTMALLAPVLGSGIEVYKEYTNHLNTVKVYEEEGLTPPNDETDIFSLSAVIGSQLDNPAISEIADVLSVGWLKNGLAYDPLEERSAVEFDRYVIVLTESFKENVLKLLTTRLQEMGYSETLGLVKTILTTRVVV
jgi:hypothetical protein